jgi:hypothetical protein
VALHGVTHLVWTSRVWSIHFSSYRPET